MAQSFSSETEKKRENYYEILGEHSRGTSHLDSENGQKTASSASTETHTHFSSRWLQRPLLGPNHRNMKTKISQSDVSRITSNFLIQLLAGVEC